MADSLLIAEADGQFDEECSPSDFCTACVSPVCRTCCREHVTSHPHPHPHPGSLYEVFHVEGSSMRFNWEFVQRLGASFGKYIFLRECNEGATGTKRCACGKRIQRKNKFCSPSCKLNGMAGGGDATVVALVNGDYGQLAPKDRYCRSCELAFSSAHCDDHDGHHGPGVAAGNVIRIIRQGDRWFVPEEQIPEHRKVAIMFQYANYTSTDYVKTGKGSPRLQLINQRSDFSFALFSGGLSNPKLIARSDNTTFVNPKAPVYPRLAQGKSWNELY